MAFKCRAIKNAVAAEFGIGVKEIDTRDRTTNVARARMTAAHLCRTEIKPTPSLPWIGRQFGGLHHTTILHAGRRITQLSEANPAFAAMVERCRVNVTDGPSAETVVRNGWHGEARVRHRRVDDMSVWTDERVEKMTALWYGGFSASQIASRLGAGITRNAVIGKLTRLKLTGRQPSAPVTPAQRRSAQ